MDTARKVVSCATLGVEAVAAAAAAAEAAEEEEAVTSDQLATSVGLILVWSLP